MNRLFIITCVVAFGLAACSGSKSFSKKGDKLLNAGDYRSAADFYYTSLLKNSTNVNARIGLNDAGQKVMEDYLEEFFRTHHTDNHKEAVYAYRSAIDYKKKLERFNIKLSVPPVYQEDYNNSKSIYLAELYQKGQALLDEDKFAGAQKYFDEINLIDPDYKDAADLQSVSIIEPKYREANALLARSAYRRAYYLLDEVFQQNPSYKDVKELRDMSLQEGMYTIGFARGNDVRYSEQANTIYSYTMSALTNNSSPFLKVVDRENLDKILKEQELSLTGIFTNSDASKAGELIGADALFTGEVLTYKVSESGISGVNKNGFEKYTVKKYDKATDKTTYETKYRPVTYVEYYGSNSVSISFRYKLTSLKTGEILLSNVEEKTIEDQLHYADYKGNWREIYPAASNNQVNLDFGSKNRLNNLFSGDRTLTPITEMRNMVYDKVAGQIASQLNAKVNTLE